MGHLQAAFRKRLAKDFPPTASRKEDVKTVGGAWRDKPRGPRRAESGMRMESKHKDKRGSTAHHKAPQPKRLPKPGQVESGDWIRTEAGLRGKIVGEGFLGNRRNPIPAWKIDAGGGRITAVTKDDAQLWHKGQDIEIAERGREEARMGAHAKGKLEPGGAIRSATDPSAAMRNRPQPKPKRLGEPAGPRSLAGEKTRDFSREQFKPGFVRAAVRKAVREVAKHRDARGSTAHHKRDGGGQPRRQLSVPEKHQLRIARQNAEMNPALQGVMGGPGIEESKKIIERLTGRPYRRPKVSPWTGKPYGKPKPPKTTAPTEEERFRRGGASAKPIKPMHPGQRMGGSLESTGGW